MTHPTSRTRTAAGRYRVQPPTMPAQVERVDTVLRAVRLPGLVLIGPTERTYVRHLLYPHHVIPATSEDDITTHQLLDRGWFRRADRDTVARHRAGDSAADAAPRVSATVVAINPARRTEVERWWAEHVSHRSSR